jgi:hypothetical protein
VIASTKRFRQVSTCGIGGSQKPSLQLSYTLAGPGGAPWPGTRIAGGDAGCLAGGGPASGRTSVGPRKFGPDDVRPRGECAFAQVAIALACPGTLHQVLSVTE